MYERLNERISVVAVFGDPHSYKKVRPFKIKWKGREYLIREVGYVHPYKEGKTLFHVFSVTDGTNFFELHFNTDELEWVLGRVADNEAN